LGDQRNDGESNCNSGDGTGQMAQPWIFMMMINSGRYVRYIGAGWVGGIKALRSRYMSAVRRTWLLYRELEELSVYGKRWYELN
jgi:hypothetical protein